MPDEVYVRKTCIIGLDTQASGSITNDPRLVDTSHDYGKVTVTGWDGQSGSTVYCVGIYIPLQAVVGSCLHPPPHPAGEGMS